MAELFVFGPAIAGGAAIVFFGRRLLDRAGLARRPAIVTAVLAAVAAGATWLVFVLDALFYAVGENGPEYYDFSAYEEYGDLATNGLWFIPISLGYAALATGLALGAAVVWRRVPHRVQGPGRLPARRGRPGAAAGAALHSRRGERDQNEPQRRQVLRRAHVSQRGSSG